jgi:peptidoglycan/LPS O-acetylase OafA/YrhL
MDRVPALTGLRAVAAYAVLIAHAIDRDFVFGTTSRFHDPASRLAYFGMSLFFVLSGFVIQYNYGQSFVHDGWGLAACRFYAARFARLYPLYAVTILRRVVADVEERVPRAVRKHTRRRVRHRASHAP